VTENLEQQDALLVNLVLIFQNAAMQQMGKITNPMTGKIEKNLEQARFSIDMIDMLRSKTRGNLSSDLEKLLDTTLTNLRMNYVDEANKEASGEGEAKEEAQPPEDESTDAGGPEDEETGVGDRKTGVKEGAAEAGGPAAGTGEGSESVERTGNKDASEN
jgi:hypothetical protein